MSAPEGISGPVGNRDMGESSMTPEFMEVLAAESRAARGVMDTEKDTCMTELRAADESTIALLAELRGHVERTGYWTCETHSHWTRAEEIIDTLEARYTTTKNEA